MECSIVSHPFWGYPYLWKSPFHVQEKLEEVTLYYHNFNMRQVQGHVMTWMLQQGMRKILYSDWDHSSSMVRKKLPALTMFLSHGTLKVSEFHRFTSKIVQSGWPASNKAHSFLWNWNPQSPSTFPKGSCIGSWQSEHRAWSNRRRHHPASTAHPSGSSWLITQSDFIYL